MASNTSGRAASWWAVVAAGVAALDLALIWLTQMKPVVCAAAIANGCDPAARLVSAQWASVVIAACLAVALVAAYAVPSGSRSGIMKPLVGVLGAAGVLASAGVLISAGFVLWPIWA